MKIILQLYLFTFYEWQTIFYFKPLYIIGSKRVPWIHYNRRQRYILSLQCENLLSTFPFYTSTVLQNFNNNITFYGIIKTHFFYRKLLIIKINCTKSKCISVTMMNKEKVIFYTKNVSDVQNCGYIVQNE